jgi:hypothetical protein
MMAAGGVLASETAALISGPIFLSLLPFASLAVTASIMGGFAEPIVIALLLAAILLLERKRWVSATILLAAALLTKEIVITAIVGIMVWHLLRREYTGLLVGLSVIPYLAWAIFIHARFGSFPWSDPWWHEHAFGTPFLALWRTLSGGGSAAVVAAVHAALALSVLAFWRRNQFATIALLSGVQVFLTVRFDWSYLVDGLRGVTMLEVFWILGVAMVLQDRSARSRFMRSPASDPVSG